MEGARIGKNCRIFPGAVISAIPQDLKFEGEDSLTVIGDNTTIRECVTINRGTSDASGKTIGNNCLIMATAHIAHDCVLGDNSYCSNGHCFSRPCYYWKNTQLLEVLAAVHQFIILEIMQWFPEALSFRKDVPPMYQSRKEPLILCWHKFIGLRRRGLPQKKLEKFKNIYRILYQKNYNNTQAIRYY